MPPILNSANTKEQIKKKKKNTVKTLKPEKLIESQFKKVPKQRLHIPYDAIKANRGVVFFKHMPHNFNENEMKNFFEQFGKIARINLIHSEKTGNSCGYGYIEFFVKEVAEIAATTMNNYIMFNQVCKAEYIPPEKQKNSFFKRKVTIIIKPDGTQELRSSKTLALEKEKKIINASPTVEKNEKHYKKTLKKLKLLTKKYKQKYPLLDEFDVNDAIVGFERCEEVEVPTVTSPCVKNKADDNVLSDKKKKNKHLKKAASSDDALVKEKNPLIKKSMDGGIQKRTKSSKLTKQSSINKLINNNKDGIKTILDENQVIKKVHKKNLKNKTK